MEVHVHSMELHKRALYLFGINCYFSKIILPFFILGNASDPKNFLIAENNLQTLKYYTGYICCYSYENAMNSPKRHAKLIWFGIGPLV